MKTLQNRTDLYENQNAILVDEGVYMASIVQIRHLMNQFGKRVGLVFRIHGGDYDGVQILDTASNSNSPKGKLAEMLRGLCSTIPDDLNDLVGKPCRIAIKHEVSSKGKKYAAIAHTFN